MDLTVVFILWILELLGEIWFGKSLLMVDLGFLSFGCFDGMERLSEITLLVDPSAMEKVLL